ncbi:DegT/DnrJ/EryC1/StrS family aminotransferase [Hyphococcus sp.]|uniref:DegT/DnrJ/EryC1/StrS family aminotransferase n=1 Tax=Hyphococcus sp. TaxID=2038636 RepID=UPI00208B5BF1|nr:MAG: aminotransferase DegT [Marinicaulis sp.]
MKTSPDVHKAEPIPEAARKEIDALLSSGDLFRYTSGMDSPVSKLEKEFAEFLGVRYALAVNSCSSALFLSLRALGLGSGDKILLPAFTFAAVPSSVIHAGCEPVLVNVGENYRILLDEFEEKLSGDVSAVMISHMRGHTSDMTEILRLCEARNVPIIEDAAHSLGTTWSRRKIGSLGKVGCFSFQSYKLVNAGEGGILVSDDAEIMARAVIMSGAYEENWKKHPVVSDYFPQWQNKLPLFNLRMNNLSAAVIRPQLGEIPARVKKGRLNHDYVAKILNASDWFSVPAPLDLERRAPDSIQFNLCHFEDDEEVLKFQGKARDKGVEIQVFGLSQNNARTFWNWEFIGPQGDLTPTRNMLKRACDVRLPVHLEKNVLDSVANVLVSAADEVKASATRLLSESA